MSVIEINNPITGSTTSIPRSALVTSAQLLAMFATPVSVIPSPGAGLAIVLESGTIHKPAGTAYGGIAVGEDLTFKYTDQAGLEVAQIETTGFLDQATAQTRTFKTFGAASLISSITPVANAAIVIALLAGEIITGTSALHVRLNYRIVPMDVFAS